MYNLVEKNDAYLEFQDGNRKILVPASQCIIVSEDNNICTLKTTACRKNVLAFTEV